MTDRVGILALLLAALLVAAATGPAAAFHQGGVAECGGCHIVHNSQDGRPVAAGPDNNYQLLAESPSEVCLMCHAEGVGAVLGVDPLTPPPEKGAGNFVFLLEDNLNDAPGGRLNPIPGAAAGHNIVAPAYGLYADIRHHTAPGGTFPASELGCTSCHDPHGSGTFRMLRGAGVVQDGVAVFMAPAPAAMGIDLRGGVESVDSHSAYLDGMSRWCGNCHGRFHDEGDSSFEHPSEEMLDSEVRQQYNRYDGENNPTGGTPTLAYLPDVPFEDADAAVSSREGPSPRSSVMCLTCHRAHASSAPSAGRWDFNVALLDDDGVESGSWAIPNPYAPANQGTLCRKCHESEPD